MNPLSPHPPLPKYYGDSSRRESFVRDLFDETAPWYDEAGRFMSLGAGAWYRREALKRAGFAPGMKVLDLATGTGPVARAAVEIIGDAHAVICVDPSAGMLTSGNGGCVKVQGKAEEIPFRAAAFDAITIGFALRHFADLCAVFAECHRVLRPGGRVVILEITVPESRIRRALLAAYMGTIVPMAMRLRTGNARAAELCRYYWETTRDCVRPEVILDALREAGFADARRNVELGIFSEYFGVRVTTRHSASVSSLRAV